MLQEKVKWNGSSSKKEGQTGGSEKFSTFRRNDQSKRLYKVPVIDPNDSKLPVIDPKDIKVPVIDPDDFDKLPPCSEPKVFYSPFHHLSHTHLIKWL